MADEIRVRARNEVGDQILDARTIGGKEQQVMRLAGTVGPAKQTGTITSSQPTAGTEVAGGAFPLVAGLVDYSLVGNVTVALLGSSLGTSNTVIFEASPNGGTDWYSLSGQDETTNTAVREPVFGTTIAKVYSFSLFGFDRFRVRRSAVTGGPGTINVVISPGIMIVEPVAAAVMSHPPGAVETRFVYQGAGNTSETLGSVQAYRAGAASGAAATSQAITAGKIFRLLSFSISVRATAATAGGGSAVLRYNAGGAAVIGSPAVAAAGGAHTNAIGAADGNAMGFGGIGPEFSGGQFGITYISNPATDQLVIVASGIEY